MDTYQTRFIQRLIVEETKKESPSIRKLTDLTYMLKEAQAGATISNTLQDYYTRKWKLEADIKKWRERLPSPNAQKTNRSLLAKRRIEDAIEGLNKELTFVKAVIAATIKNQIMIDNFVEDMSTKAEESHTVIRKKKRKLVI